MTFLVVCYLSLETKEELAMAATIEAQGLEKRFRKTQALAGLDLVAEPGQVTAVLGPNGAGKTTFVRAVATLLRLDAGTLRVAGHDVAREPDAVRALIGLAGQFAVLEQLGLDEAGDRLVRTYSGGMKRRLDLGASLVGAPRLLLLDEPTTGLDPRSRIELWDAIRALVEQGTDVLLTTQYLDEADQLASQVVVIDGGRTIAHGTPAEVKRQTGRNVIEVHVRDAAHVAEVARALSAFGAGEARVDDATRRVTVLVEGGAEQLTPALKPIEDRGIVLDDVALRPPRLDEAFLTLTGHAMQADPRQNA